MAIIPYINEYGQNVNEFGQKAEFVGITENEAGGSVSIPVVYGQRRIEGIRFWNYVNPANTSVLYCAYALSEDWCHGMTQLFIDDRLVELSPTSFEHRIPVQVSNGAYAGILEVEFVDGRNANSYYGSVTNIGPSTMLQRDLNVSFNWTKLCYIVCKFTYVVDGVYTQFPKVSVDLSGRKIPSWGVSNTTVYTDNPAYIIWDLMSNPTYGRSILKEKIDTTSFTAVYNACLTNRTGVLTPGALMRANWICDTSQTVLSNIQTILETFQLNLSFIQDRWVLTAEMSPNSSTLTFSETNITSDGVQITYPNVNDRYNRVIVEYIEPTNNFQTYITQYPAEGVNTFLDEDLGLVLEKRVVLNSVTNAVVANDIAQMTLRRSRNQVTYRFTATKEAYQVRVGDYVYINTTIPYINNQKCVVISMVMNSNLTFEMECISYDPTWYPTSFTNSVTVPSGPGVPAVVVPTENWSLTSTRDNSNYIAYEGQDITWNIATTGVANGTTFRWVMTGTIATTDWDVFYGTALSGTGTISSGAAVINKRAKTPNTTNGPRTVILTLYDSTGVTRLAQHQLVLTDVGTVVPTTNYTYTFATAKTLTTPTGTNDWYLGWTTVTNAYTYDSARTLSASGSQDLGYQCKIVKGSHGGVTYELYLGLIDRLAANQALNKKIYMVYQQGPSSFGYVRKSSKIIGGSDYFAYDPSGPFTLLTPYTSRVTGGARYSQGLRTYTEVVTESDLTNYDSGCIPLTRIKSGQYELLTPLRIAIDITGNVSWPTAADIRYGSFFSHNNFDSSNYSSGYANIVLKFFEHNPVLSTNPIVIGTYTLSLALTTAKMNNQTIAASRTAWTSLGTGLFATAPF